MSCLPRDQACLRPAGFAGRGLRAPPGGVHLYVSLLTRSQIWTSAGAFHTGKWATCDAGATRGPWLPCSSLHPEAPYLSLPPEVPGASQRAAPPLETGGHTRASESARGPFSRLSGFSATVCLQDGQTESADFQYQALWERLFQHRTPGLGSPGWCRHPSLFRGDLHHRGVPPRVEPEGLGPARLLLRPSYRSRCGLLFIP